MGNVKVKFSILFFSSEKNILFIIPATIAININALINTYTAKNTDISPINTKSKLLFATYIMPLIQFFLILVRNSNNDLT
jgi:hypothetical protein